MVLEVRILCGDEGRALANIAPGVFDDPIDEAGRAAFFADPRHILGVATDGELIVGMVSAVEYFHPDKPRSELWINEVGVALSHRRLGLGRKILEAVLAEGRARGCAEAWVLTDRGNAAAMALYASVPGALAPRDEVSFTFAL